jgi:AmmeMemoRadiSam system protein B
MELTVRQPAVAGAFYPSSKRELSAMIDGFLDSTSKFALSKIPKRAIIRGLVLPHAGYIYSGIVAASGFNLVKKEKFARNPKVVLLGPSHHTAFNGLATCSYTEWETPLGRIKIDPLTLEFTRKYPNDVTDFDTAHVQEHCLEVEVPFLQTVLPSFSLIPLLTGDGEPRRFAEILIEYEKGIDFFVISSDLSHYYPYEAARRLDARANEAIPTLDIKKVESEVEACGKQGILTLMHMAKKKNWQGVLVDYKNSGDTAGDRNAVVGYGCYAFYELPTCHSERSEESSANARKFHG